MSLWRTLTCADFLVWVLCVRTRVFEYPHLQLCVDTPDLRSPEWVPEDMPRHPVVASASLRKVKCMSLLAVFGIGIGLSADAFAAALTHGLRMRMLYYRRAVIIALTFAGFQALMPLLGWLLASQFTRHLDPVDHWIAFGLLFLIGAKMIWDACGTDAGNGAAEDGLHIGRLLMLGIATSIDAAAVGVSFAVLEISILQSILIIGATTLVLSFIAVVIGHRIGVRFRTPAEIIGGLVLIAIGTRILLEDVGIF